MQALFDNAATKTITGGCLNMWITVRLCGVRTQRLVFTDDAHADTIGNESGRRADVGRGWLSSDSS